jgi:transposase-like protein
MVEPALVTAADIARLAGVTRGTVSNWRRRHQDFPAPVGGTDASPAYDRAGVEAWLEARGALPELSAAELLWRTVIAEAEGSDLGKFVEWAAVRAAELSPDQVPPAQSPAAGVGSPELRGALERAVAANGAWETVDTLIDQYADTAGIARTPAPVVSLMGALAEVSGGAGRSQDAVLDPAAGTGELLGCTADWSGRVLGQELDPALARLAQIRVPEAQIATGDSLRADQFAGEMVDVVLCHPPFGDRDWGQEELAGDPRWAYGIPPKSEPELAWVQHVLSHLKPGGRAVVLLPPAVASRPSARRIRAELVRRGALRAVIALPSGLVRPVHVPVYLWVFRRPADTIAIDPRVLFVDVADLDWGSEWGSRGQASSAESRNPRHGEIADTVLSAWRMLARDDKRPDTGRGLPGEPDLWQVVRAIDLLDDEVDLAPARHVATAGMRKTPRQTAHEARTLRDQVSAALTTVGAALPRDQWPVSRTPPSWSTTSLAELARRGLLEYVRGGEQTSDGVAVRPGDVLISALAAGGKRPAVVTEADEGVPLDQRTFLIRPDTGQFDSWFLAGFLATSVNVQRTSSGSSALRLPNARHLTVPLLPLADQRRNGAAFRALHDLQDAAARAGQHADELARLLTEALAEGTLLPPTGPEHEPGQDPQEQQTSQQTSHQTSQRPAHSLAEGSVKDMG